jgi:hypothetical protein
MAAGSDGEDENYWPGYVDALTTMTMVLTFILMVLGIVVFSLSQSVSRAYLEAIAEAAQVEGASKSKTVQDLQNAIVEKLLSKPKDHGTQAPQGQPLVVSGLQPTAETRPSDNSDSAAVETTDTRKVLADAAEGGAAQVKLADPDPVPYAKPTGGGIAEESNTLSGMRQTSALSETANAEGTTRRTGEGPGGTAASGTAPTALAAVNETPAGVPGGEEKNLLPSTGRKAGDNPGARPTAALLSNADSNVLVPESAQDGTFKFALPLPVPGSTNQPEVDNPNPAALAHARPDAPADKTAAEQGGNSAIARLDPAPTPPTTPPPTSESSSVAPPTETASADAVPNPPAAPVPSPAPPAAVVPGAAAPPAQIASADASANPPAAPAPSPTPNPSSAPSAETAPTPGTAAPAPKETAAADGVAQPPAPAASTGPAPTPAPAADTAPPPAAEKPAAVAEAKDAPREPAPPPGAEPGQGAPQPVQAASVPLPRSRPASLTEVPGQLAVADATGPAEPSTVTTAPGTGGPGRGTAAVAHDEPKGDPGPNAAATRSAVNRAAAPEVGPAYAALLPEESPTSTPRSGGVSDEGNSTVGVPLSRKAPPQPVASEMFETTLPAQLRKPGVGAQVTTSGATLTIRFLPKAINLSEQDKGALKLALLDQHVKSAREFKVNGVAAVTDGFSDERRSAFFRMMVVRNELVNSGFSADKIKLQLIESTDKSDANVVKILAVP